MRPQMAGCLICKADDGGGDEEPANDDNDDPTSGGDTQKLRNHMVEQHAEFVARAFLHPDINDSLHLWLMTCVRYELNGVNTGGALENGDVDEDTNGHVGEDDDDDDDGDVDEEENDDDEHMDDANEQDEENGDAAASIIDLSTVLNAIFESSDPSICNAFEEFNHLASASLQDATNAMSSRKRSACLDDVASFGSIAKKRPFDVKPNVEDKSDKHPLGLVDSKAKNKVTCAACNIEVCNTARQRHVFLVHVRKDDLYRCPECPYQNSNSIWETRRHCQVQHGSKVEPVNNEEKYKNLILPWNRKCFPEWKHKKPYSWAPSGCNADIGDDDEDSNLTAAVDGKGKDEVDDDVTLMIRDAILSNNDDDETTTFNNNNEVDSGCASRDDEQTLDSESLLANLVNAVTATVNVNVAPPSMTSGPAVRERESTGNGGSTALGVDDRTCQLCFEESRYPGRHIAQKHLKRSLYECPVCETFGSYESCTVVKHIQKVHPEVTDTPPISNLERFADLLRDLQYRCFPNRPMKLVRSNMMSRPRERHTCRICDAQVAQSDRQRHVYHRHLGKERIFECPLCPYSSNYDVHRIKWHLKWMHKDESGVEPISHENEYREEIDRKNDECFPDWNHRNKRSDSPASVSDAEVEPEVEPEQEAEPDKAPEPDDEEEDSDDDDDGNSSLEGSKAGKKDETTPNANGNGVRQRMIRVSEWTCRLCFKEFKPTSNFLRHVAKDHLDVPLFQCPYCDDGAADAYEVKGHMAKYHGEAHGEPISNLERNPTYVQKRFLECFPNRKLKPGFDKKTDSSSTLFAEDTKVTCQECLQEMKTEDRQIHVYRHHLKVPRLYECPLCDFAHHACSSDVRAHIKFTHRDQPDVAPRSNLFEYSRQIAEWNLRCFPGWINRKLPASCMEDFTRCRMCDKDVRQTSRHIAEEHLGIQLHSCPVSGCTYGAPESRLVKRHLRNVHSDTKSEPISNVGLRRSDFSALHDRCFPGRPKRLSSIIISEEGRRTKCKQCGATISRKRRLCHTLEKHINRAAFECAHCPLKHTNNETIIAAHMRAEHNDDSGEVIRLIDDFMDEVRATGASCFPDWNLELDLGSD